MKSTLRRLAFLAGILLVLVLALALWPQRHRNSVPSHSNVAVSTPAPVAAPEISPPPAPLPRTDQEPRAQEEIVGIGAALRLDNRTGLVRIMNVLPDSPAFQAGLTSGLVIQRVDDTEILGLGLAACVNMLRGPIGSKVRVEVIDLEVSSTNVVELIRQRIKVRQ